MWFSRYGNLLETAREFVEDSDSGLTASELTNILYVETKEALLNLVRRKRVHREMISGIYAYVSEHAIKRRRQVLMRQEREVDGSLGAATDVAVLSEELKAAIILFFSLLDEKQRRLYAGLEAQKLGHGEDRKIVDLLGLDVHTVAKGRREVLSGEVDEGDVRRQGGGRKQVEKSARGDSDDPRTSEACACWRPRDGDQVDTKGHTEDCQRVTEVQHPRRRDNGPATAQSDGFLAAGQPQEY